MVHISSKEGRGVASGVSTGTFAIAALRAGWHVGYVPLALKVIIFPHTTQEHRLWASKKACGTALLKRLA